MLNSPGVKNMGLEKVSELKIGKRGSSVAGFLEKLIKKGELKAYTVDFQKKEEELEGELVVRKSKKPKLSSVKSLEEEKYYILKSGKNSYRFMYQHNYQDDDYGCYNPFSDDEVLLEKLVNNLSEKKTVESKDERSSLVSDWQLHEEMLSARMTITCELRNSDVVERKTVIEARPKQSWIKQAIKNFGKDTPLKKEPLDPLFETIVEYLKTYKYITHKIPGQTLRIHYDD